MPLVLKMTALYVVLNAAIMLALATNVIRMRYRTRTRFGDTGNPEMMRAVRAHGNNTEYVPIALILLVLAHNLGGSLLLIHAIGLPLTVGRVLHGLGFLERSHETPHRPFHPAPVGHDPDVPRHFDRHSRMFMVGGNRSRLMRLESRPLVYIFRSPALSSRRLPARFSFRGSMSKKLPDPAAADRLDALVKAALKSGADAADAVEFKNISVGVSYRLGKLEDVGRAESSDLGLRVFVGQQVAFVSSTDFSDAALAVLPERAVAMAKLAPEDKYAGLAPQEKLATTFPELEIDDPQEPSTVLLVERARAAEGAALEVPGVTNSEGGSADYGRTMVTLATSAGFLGGYTATSRSVAVSVIAGEGTEMERDYDYAHSRFAADLESAEAVGKRAGRTRGETPQSPQSENPGGAGFLRSARLAQPGRTFCRRHIGERPSRAASVS